MKKSYIIVTLLLLGAGSYYLGTRSSLDELKTDSSKVVRSHKKKRVVNPVLSLPSFSYDMPKVELLSPLGKTVVGIDTDLNYVERAELVWKLRDEVLTEADFKAFYTFLITPPKEEGNQLILHSLKNDLLVFVIDDGRYKESTAKFMLDVLNDKNQHQVMREYTMQYITDFFERHWLTQGVKVNEKRKFSQSDLDLQITMVTTMWDLLNHQKGAMAGTALLRLNDLSKNFSFIDRDRLEDETARLIESSSVPPSSKMAALSIAEIKKLDYLKPHVQKIALSDDGDISLRMAAIHTLSTLESSDDLLSILENEFIEKKGIDSRLKIAAEYAVKKLKKTRG
ncbi:MAG: hypothetical protein NE330_06810 [Lentisphaeraceae bacterium]|nr:hypothetical protein [Lentisphaeraceae bacterium]